jgi:hypothetical protein
VQGPEPADQRDVGFARTISARDDDHVGDTTSARLTVARRGQEPVSSTTAPASAATKTLRIPGAAVRTWNVPTTSRAVNPG